MKIIGTTSNGFIIECSKRELAYMNGFTYESELEPEHTRVGRDVPLSQTYDSIESIKHARPKVEKLQRELLDTADRLGKALDLPKVIEKRES